MPAPKTYTRAQWDEFARLLDTLPDKPPSERRITVRDAMSDVRTHINAARAKGYSLEQLIEQATQAGIDVSISALRYALQETMKRRASNQRTGESRSPSGTTRPINQRSARPVSKRALHLGQTPKAKTRNSAQWSFRMRSVSKSDRT